MKLRIGHLSTFFHTSILLMARGDSGERLGADIDWRLFGTGPAIVNAFEKGELDLAYIGLPPSVIGMSRGVAIVCVAGGHMEGTVIAAKKNFAGFAERADLGDILRQFRGRKIGVPGRGSIHDVIIRECLGRFELQGAVEIVNFPWADQVLEAVVKEEVSAAVGTPALATAIVRFAGGGIIYPPSMLWPHNPSYGIIVGRDFLRREREVAERYLLLHEEATALLRSKPGEAARMISSFVGVVDAAFVMDTLRVSPKYCAQLTDEYISSTMDFVGVLKKLGYITRDVGPGEIFDTSLIRKVHPGKDHYGEGISEDL